MFAFIHGEVLILDFEERVGALTMQGWVELYFDKSLGLLPCGQHVPCMHNFKHKTFLFKCGKLFVNPPYDTQVIKHIIHNQIMNNENHTMDLME